MNLNPVKLLQSFGFALSGLKHVWASQQNFRIHLMVATIVLAAGTFAKLTPGEWCIIILTIVLVLSLEIVNTAIEKIVDFISPGFHEQAGRIKDISAAAVLVAALAAVIVGLIIFLPRVFLNPVK